MGKTPCFPFYPCDFFGDVKVRIMSPDAQAYYLLLLANIWEYDTQYSIPDDESLLANLLRIDRNRLANLMTEIRPCFLIAKGRLVSKRLKQEKEKQDNYRKLQSDKGKLSAQQRFNRGSTVVQPEGQPKVNSSNPIPNSIPKYSQTSDEVSLSEYLFSFIKKRDQKAKAPNIQEWAIHIDRLMRIDKRTPTEIKETISWCQKNEFWQNNILSTSKLRKQFTQLYLKMRDNNGNSGNGKGTPWIQPREHKPEPRPEVSDSGGTQIKNLLGSFYNKNPDHPDQT